MVDSIETNGIDATNATEDFHCELAQMACLGALEVMLFDLDRVSSATLRATRRLGINTSCQGWLEFMSWNECRHPPELCSVP